MNIHTRCLITVNQFPTPDREDRAEALDYGQKVASVAFLDSRLARAQRQGQGRFGRRHWNGIGHRVVSGQLLIDDRLEALAVIFL
jgi:hypothetical protein